MSYKYKIGNLTRNNSQYLWREWNSTWYRNNDSIVTHEHNIYGILCKDKFNPEHKILTSVRCRGKNVDSSSKSNPLRRCGKNYDVSTKASSSKKLRKSTNFQQKFVWFTYSNNAHRNSVCVIRNKQFNKKTKLWKQNGRCLDDVTTAL